MSAFPINESAMTVRRPRATPAYVLDGWSLGCGRTELHMCKLKSGEELSILWPWLRHGLRTIAAKNPKRTYWLPEHLRMQIALGLAGQNQLECFVAHENGEGTDMLHGFLMAYPLIDPFVQLPLTWFVWMANIGPRVMEKLMPEFEEMARKRGFVRWQWGTSRMGWARRAARFGASVVELTIGKDLED